MVKCVTVRAPSFGSMHKALRYLSDRFGVSIPGSTRVRTDRQVPIELPNVGRSDLPGMLRDMGAMHGAEIGVRDGSFSEELCRGIPNVRLVCVDPWAPYEGYQNERRHEAFYRKAMDRLGPFSPTVLRMTSREALGHVHDDSLDFVYIDGDHELSAVVFDLVQWSRKVKSGGIISGHDFKTVSNLNAGHHVVEAVFSVTWAYNIVPYFVIGTKAVLPGVVRDGVRSFMWVKP